MVTLILAFIFLTPHLIHYGDRRSRTCPRTRLRLGQPRRRHDLCGPVELIQAQNGDPTDQELANAIAPTSGPVTVDRRQAVKEIGGRVVAWRVWGHR